MIKKMFLMFVICLLVFSLSGCGDTEEQTSPGNAFLGGQAGLKAEFVDGMPPDSILDNDKQNFGIGIKLENMGEADVLENDGYIEIVGINAKDFGKTGQSDLKKNVDDEIKGAKRSLDGDRIKGGLAIVEFPDLKYKQDLPGESSLQITADICYNYKTRAASKICVKKELLRGLDTDKICKVSEEKDVENSGGPVQITSVKQNPVGEGKIQLLFTIAHVGSPEDSFFKRGTDCEEIESNSDRYKVYFKVLNDVDGKKPQCSGLDSGSGSNVDKSEGYITLFSKAERQLSCTLNVEDVDTIFEKVMSFELEYRYFQSLQKDLKIRDVS